MRFLPFIFKNIRRNRRRTALTMASIAVSLFLFTALLTILSAMDRIESRAEGSLRIACHHRMSLVFTLPESYVKKLRQVPGIVAVCPFTWYGGVLKDPKDFFTTLSVDVDTLTAVWGDAFELEPREWAAFASTRIGAIVGPLTAQKYGLKVGDRFTLKGTLQPVDLELQVCSIPAKTFDQRAVLIQRRYLEEALGNPGIASNIWCKVDRAESIPRLMTEIDAMFANSQYETLTETEKSFATNMIAMMGNIRGMVGGIGLIVVLTIMLVAGNSVAMSVRERTTEVAVLKAIGFRPHHVLGFILSEAMLVAFLGGLAGSLGAVALFGSSAFTSKLGPLGSLFVADHSNLLGAMAVSLAIGAAAGLVPAVSAARLGIVDALRKVA